MSFARRLWAFLLYFFFAGCWLLKKRPIHLVYASSTPLSVGVLGVWCKMWQKIPMVFEVVDLWPDVPVEMGLLRNTSIISHLYKLEKWIYQKADKIVVLSEGMKERIISKGVLEIKLLVAHNGTDCSVFAPCVDKKRAKRSFGFSVEEFLVLYAGTVGQANGLSFLVEVANQVQALGENAIRFVVLGSGNRREEVMHLANEKSVSNMLFLETVPKTRVRHYFDAADVGTVIFAPYPILETNSANKFYDYLASGLPVVINYNGWQKDYLRAYDCGTSESEAHRFAQQLVDWKQNPEKLVSMGRNARDLALHHFDRKDIAHKIAMLFQQICE